MDGFNTKFIKLIEDIKEGNIMISELDKYVSNNCNKGIFSKAIVSLMDNTDDYVKIFSSRYSFDYNIDKKKAYFNARYILRRSNDLNCRLEAKYIYDRYKRRYISSMIRLFSRKRIK